MTNLYNHQKEFLKQNPDKSSLIWSCGTGKTRTSIEWAKLGEFGTLIICPKSLKTNWIREIERWGLQAFTVLTKEEFRRDAKELPPYQQIIVDEVHNGFLTPLFRSEMSKALRSYLKKHNVPRVLLLTATPYTASPWNIYNLALYTGHAWNYRTFEQEFFYNVRMGNRIIPQAKKGSEAKLAKIVKRIASVVNIEDILDVPLQNHLDPEYFALTTTQIKAIKESYDPLPIVRYTHENEIENGILYGNEFTASQSFVCDKHERILALVEENTKVAVVARYNGQIDLLAKLLAKHNPYIIRGDVKDRDAVCLAAEAAPKAVVLIQADCGIGFQLPSFGLCVYASMSYSYTSKIQMDGRFLRVDKPSRTTFMYLLTEGDSIDKAIYESILRKEDFRIELYRK